MAVVALDSVTTHHDVPTTVVADANNFRPESALGVSKYRAELQKNAHLEALLVNRESNILVVTFHGATMRDRYKLPRFEWFRTLRSTPWNIMCFSDPALSLFPKLQLGWFTGWNDFNAQELIANWISRTASAIKANTVVLTGSSGGGFAALKIAPLVPGSVAVPFNPQTSIADYRVAGTTTSAQRNYVKYAMPHLAPKGGVKAMSPDGRELLSDKRTTAYPTWGSPHDSFVYYMSNVNDARHHQKHFEPFREFVLAGPNRNSAVFQTYEGKAAHNPPAKGLFIEAISNAIRKFAEDRLKQGELSAVPQPIGDAPSSATSTIPTKCGVADESVRDRFALNRKQMLWDYAAISQRRSGAAAATALRVRSLGYLDILATQASVGNMVWSELRSCLDDPISLASTKLNPKAVGDIGRILLLWPDDELPDPELKCTTAVSALEYAVSELPENAVSRPYRKLLVDQAIVAGFDARALGLLERWQDVDREESGYRRAELLNPSRGDAARGGEWFEAFNVPFVDAGLTEVELHRESKRAFDRLGSDRMLDRPFVDTPKVSVVMTVYNPDLEALETSVRSILSQTLTDLELIIVDDASEDQFAEGIDRWRHFDTRVSVIRLDKNGGTYRARNIGFRKAKGKFVAGQDDDDWSHPQRLEKQVELLESRSDLAGCRVDAFACLEDLCRVRVGRSPISQNASSLMLQTKMFHRMGGFLEIRKAADNEFYFRLQKVTGLKVETIAKPLSIIRIKRNSLSREDFAVGWRHPSRCAFLGSYTHWHSDASSVKLTEVDLLNPPIDVPRRFQIEPGEPEHLDVVFAGDWRQWGGPQNSMFEEICALTEAGLSVGVMHLEAARFMTRLNNPIAKPIQKLINNGIVRHVLYDDSVKVDLLFLRYPPILQFPLESRSALELKRLVIVANQAPSEKDGSDIRYLVSDCTDNARKMFSGKVMWAPQGPQVREAIAPYLTPELITSFDIPGIVNLADWAVERRARRSRFPVVGRHSRDDVMKWPESISVIKAAYPTDGSFDVRILGGSVVPQRILGLDVSPAAWTVYKKGAANAKEFLQHLDYFVFFQNSLAVEAFGRAILEAIATGVVAFLPRHFEPLFGPAAIYCEPFEVRALIEMFQKNPSAYRTQSELALEVVKKKFSYKTYLHTVMGLLGRNAGDQQNLNSRRRKEQLRTS